MSGMDARWAERDRRREAYEAELTEQEARHRAKHVATVYEALRSLYPCNSAMPLHQHAEAAVDALIASGVVFATIGSWDDNDDG